MRTLRNNVRRWIENFPVAFVNEYNPARPSGRSVHGRDRGESAAFSFELQKCDQCGRLHGGECWGRNFVKKKDKRPPHKKKTNAEDKKKNKTESDGLNPTIMQCPRNSRVQENNRRKVRSARQGGLRRKLMQVTWLAILIWFWFWFWLFVRVIYHRW